jgi:hypothetical protein
LAIGPSNEANSITPAEKVIGKEISKQKPKRTQGTKTQKIDVIPLHQNFVEADFVNKFKALNLTSIKEKIFVLLALYKNITGEKEFSASLIHTLLDKVAIDTPKSLQAMISNYLNRDKFIEKTADGFKLKYVGEEYANKLIEQKDSTSKVSDNVNNQTP